MSERAPTAASLTRLAIERIDEGEIADARLILAEALELDPGYEPAWLWFAHVAEDAGERRYCLERAVEANPESTARQDLRMLRRVAAAAPAELSDVGVPPPPPAGSAGLPPAPSRRLSGLASRKRVFAGLAVLAVAIVLAVVAWMAATRREPLYVALIGPSNAAAGSASAEIVNSARLWFDRINASGGIEGRPVQLLVYDDQNDPETAKAVASRIVADGRALLVIGHRTSPASMAAAPIYAAAGIPAITSTATADALTENDPWYFRTVFDNHTQGLLIAAYLDRVLGVERISLIAGDDDYGQSLSQGIGETFAQSGEVRHRLTIASGERFAETLASAVKELQADPDTGTVVLALQADAAPPVIAAIRAAGITAPLIGGDALGSDAFLSALATLPEEQRQPGALSDGFMAASPLIMDSLTSESLRWFEAYRGAFGSDPSWRGATTFDAAIAATAALRAADISGDPGARPAERQRIRDALAALDSPEHAVPGLLGPIYFDKQRTTPRPAVFGVARNGRFASAYEQLKPYSPSGGQGRAADLASGDALAIGGQTLERQRIVFAGITMNEIGELDTANPSFYADFFLWFNYQGDDDATDIVFVNAVDPQLGLGQPIRTVDAKGVAYRLYRVTGRFKASLEFQDFPFDRQHLVISFQNRLLPSSKLVYAIDSGLLDLPQAARLSSGTNTAVSINAIPSWQATEVQLYQDTIGSTALLGDPEATAGASGVEYSLYSADVTVERDLAAFLGKNLLPLVLLAAVTYVSLFFPHTLTEARVTFGVTGILTSAVLLASVTSILPQVGYTVAIEWGFYAFILLSATCIIIGLVGDWLYEERRLSDLRRLDLFSHIYYPAFVLAVVLAYVVTYGGR